MFKKNKDKKVTLLQAVPKNNTYNGKRTPIKKFKK